MTKLAGEELCRVYHTNHGVDAVALRFFTVYGPRQRPDMAFRRFCEAALSGDAIRLFGDGRQSRDFTYVADVVRAVRSAGRAPGVGGCAYNIGGGAPVSINDALEQLAAVSGRPLDVRRFARESGDVLHTAADVRRAREDLGFTTMTTLADGLRAELDWVRERSPAGLPLVCRADQAQGPLHPTSRTVSRAASSAPAIATAATRNRPSESMIGARRLASSSAVVAATSSRPSTRLAAWPVHSRERSTASPARAPASIAMLAARATVLPSLQRAPTSPKAAPAPPATSDQATEAGST